MVRGAILGAIGVGILGAPEVGVPAGALAAFLGGSAYSVGSGVAQALLWAPIQLSIKMYEYDKNVYLPVLEAAQAECSAVANAASPQP